MFQSICSIKWTVASIDVKNEICIMLRPNVALTKDDALCSVQKIKYIKADSLFMLLLYRISKLS